MRCYRRGSQRSISSRMPLLCEFGVFGLNGIRALNQAKRLFDRATFFESGEDMRITLTEMHCCFFDIFEVVPLHLNWNAGNFSCVTWTWF